MQNTGGPLPLLFSLLSLLVAASSLAWNVYTNRRQEAAPEVKIDWALNPTPQDDVTAGSDGDRSHVQQRHDPYITVRVANSGRGQVDISQITFRSEYGYQGTAIGKRSHPPLPHTLEGGSERDWQFRFDTVLATLHLTRREAEKIYAVVRLGTGKTVNSDKVYLGELFRLLGSVTWHDRGTPEWRNAID